MPTNESLVHILDKAYEQKPLKEIIQASPAALQGVSEKDAEALKQAFNIKTIKDLAENKYIRWAQALTTLAAQEK